MITYETENTHQVRSGVTYRTKSTHPGTLPFATIYLDGLLCLCFDDAKKCTIGVNEGARDGHTWKFWIVDQESNSILSCNQEDFPNLQEIHIDVTGGATGGAYVYNGDTVGISAGNENRFNLESSWIDLEGPRGHNKPVKNDAKTLWPRFYLNDGLFCASKLSVGSFDLMDNNRRPLIKPLGKIALQVVADIFLDQNNPQRKIEVKLPGNTVSLDNSRRYQIYISNDCSGDSLAPLHTDFHMHYNAFSGAFDGRPGKMKAGDRFHLVYHNAVSATGKTDSVGAQTVEPDYFTDKAPCMNIALGQTKEFI